jgi:protein-disulfide isomerase
MYIRPMPPSRTLLLPCLLLTAVGVACAKELPAGGGGKPGVSGDAVIEGRLAKLESRLNALIDALAPRLGPAEPDPRLVYAVPIADEDPTSGPADAKITLVEGFEFACPHCFRAHPIVQRVLKTYGDDIRLVSKYLVVHEQAIPAGLAACAANLQGKYPEMVDEIWRRVFEARDFEQATLDKIAGELSLDIAKFKADADMENQSGACVSWLRGSAETLGTLGANGTPAFFINGRFLSGAQPFEAFKKLIDEEMAKADKAIAGGIAKADYYKVSVVDVGRKESSWAFLDGEAAPADGVGP